MNRFLKKIKKTTKTTNTNTNVEKHVQNSHAAQTISKAPNQSVTAKIFSATKYFDPPKEI